MTATVSPMEIYALLPKENCGKCNYPNCMAFAVKMVSKKAFLDQCPPLKDPKYIKQMMALKELVGKLLGAKETRLVVHEELCNGCGNCVISCPLNVSISLSASGGKGPENNEIVMKMKDGKVAVVNLKMCRRFEGDVDTRPCTVCVESCPFKAIEFI